MAKRKSNKREFKNRTDKKVWAIIVDGETEVWYFQMLKHHEKKSFYKHKTRPSKKEKARRTV